MEIVSARSWWGVRMSQYKTKKVLSSLLFFSAKDIVQNFLFPIGNTALRIVEEKAPELRTYFDKDHNSLRGKTFTSHTF